MSQALVDILVPAYNAAATVREALESLTRQTLAEIRIVVVDDGSTDDTPTILAELARRDARIVVLQKPNSGIVDALNHGLAHCTAEFVARFDADDISYPDRMAAQLTYLREHPECVAVAGRVRHIDVAGHSIAGLPHPGSPESADPSCIPAREPYLIHPFLMTRRAAVTRAGGYRHVVNSEDTDLYWRLREQGRLHNLDTVLGEYRLHADSISGRSLVNGRVMAVCSQLAAISALRRLAGRPDLTFPADRKAAYQEAHTLASIYELARTELDKEESERLAIAAAAKFLELASYRPYELEQSDCAFIREAVAQERFLSKRNRAELRWLVTVTAARLIRAGLIAHAGALLPRHLYPIVAARLLHAAISRRENLPFHYKAGSQPRHTGGNETTRSKLS
jgi:glycosyltransferase involved in cell wall biosynthesis